MFSWARAEVFRHRFGVPMLAPQWTQAKLGPLLRREKDLRFYNGLFDNRSYIVGLPRLVALASRKWIDGASIGINADPKRVALDPDGLIVFEGWQGWFRDDLLIHRAYVRERLEAILSQRVREEIRSFDRPLELALHVRRGDMARNLVAAGAEMGGPDENEVQSEYYFLSVIRQIRKVAGRSVPATVFTDAHEGELKQLPAEPDVHMAGSRSPIADIWCMSRSKILITSSASSFSAWASYLGGMPTIWQRTRVGLALPDRPEFAIEADPHGTLSERAQELIRERLRQGAHQSRDSVR
jgi:glycosyl transferase family 11